MFYCAQHRTVEHLRTRMVLDSATSPGCGAYLANACADAIVIRRYDRMVDAQPELVLLARALNEFGLEAILIGNMAAALHGAPVSTIDIDLFFRKTPRNMQKLKRVAAALEAVILRPYYPVSALFRLHRDRDGLQIDFMGHIDGVKSYESVRGRADLYQIGGQKLLAASLDDIIGSKRAAGREKDLAVIDILEKTRDEEAIAKESRKRGV
jgi:predicted nucleotidyltransferase